MSYPRFKIKKDMMTKEDSELLGVALSTIQNSLNLLELKTLAAEKVLKQSHPTLYAEYERVLGNERQGSITVVAQMLEDVRQRLQMNPPQ